MHQLDDNNMPVHEIFSPLPTSKLSAVFLMVEVNAILACRDRGVGLLSFLILLVTPRIHPSHKVTREEKVLYTL